jgi:hypothetical protein
MIQPTSRSPWPTRQADLASGPITCATCGCRLKVDAFEETWRHFEGTTGRDARGCRVECVTLAHDAHGIALMSYTAG